MKTMSQSHVGIQSDRVVYFDYLKVFAAFMVVILHVSAQTFYVADVNSIEWQTSIFYHGIRWSVPVFVMISGALFLDKENSVKKLYFKYCFRMVTSYIIWSVVYVLFFHEYKGERDLVIALINGYYHMWYILMIIGLYICVPIIKMLVENEEIMKYYMLLSFVFAFFVPWITTLTYDFANELLIGGVKAISSDISSMCMNVVTGYVSYFILGYYLNKTDFNKQRRKLIYLLGLIGFAATVGFNLLVALKTQVFCEKYDGYFNVNVLLQSIAVFVWFKYQKYNWNKLNLFIHKLSKYSFGAYLVHALIIGQLNVRFGLNASSFHPVISIPCLAVLVFVISMIISAILNQIPIIKKYIV